MIDFSIMKVGDKIPLPIGFWDDSSRAVLADAKNFARLQDPKWQFQIDRIVVGNKSVSPPTKDQYIIERIK